jgi:hypothetical protein
MTKTSLLAALLLVFTLLYGTWHFGRWYGYRENSVDSYNQGYRSGMLYAYDNVVVCGVSPEVEGMNIANTMERLGELDSSEMVCGE